MAKNLVAIPQKAIKIKSVVGNPTVAIRKAEKAGTVELTKEGVAVSGQTLVLGYLYGKMTERFQHTRNVPQPDGSVKSESWPALRGEFECVNVEGTTAHRAPVAFMQDHIIELLGAELDRAREADPSASLVIAYEIQAQTSDSASAGFVWQMQPRMQPETVSDPLAGLARIAKGEDAPALAPPEPAGEVEKAPEPVAKGGKAK